MNDFTSAVASMFAVGRTLEFTVEDRRGPLSPEDAAAVRALAHEAESNDGVAPLSEQPLLSLESSEAPVRHVLARASSSEQNRHTTGRGARGPRGPRLPPVLAYAQIDLGGTSRAGAELVVHPLVRRRGIGLAVLSRAMHVASARDRSLALWAHGDLPAARRLARSRNLTVVRELWRMERPLPASEGLEAEGLAAGDAPAGYRARTFVAGQDEPAWVRLNSRVFADHPEQGRVTMADVRAREAEDWFDGDGFVLVERESDGEPVGYCWTKVPPETPRVGEIYVLGVDESARGTGLGAWLLRAGLERLAARGATTVELYVDGDNEAAVATYERAGFKRATADVQLAVG
ncbi:mycothiol synthase [Luteimicrobium sp. NPDC057192]|uniref:mycothiol synthase n=1 Tax=Luteimicrobium sp. NPDC057192 TaxID=3346042 RepID=UPI00362E5FEF